MTTVLITGASRGIGLEFARQYAEDGARVIASCRHPDQAPDLRAVAKDYSNIEVHTLDVTCGESVAAFKAEVGDTPIDILINNAGATGGKRQALDNMDYDAWADCLNTNTIGPFRIAAAFADNVAASDEKKIITLSSFMGSIGRKGDGAYIYRTSKAGANMVTTLIATELADKGIMAIPGHPSWVKTEMGGKYAETPVHQSVTGLRKVIAELTPEKSGKFWKYDGEELPW